MTATRRQEVFDAIGRERRHQELTHDGASRSVEGWLLIVECELAEAKEAWVRSKSGDDAAALRELLEVAACCVAAMEQHGLYERKSTTTEVDDEPI